MTIQHPPNDEIPMPVPEPEPDPAPIDTPPQPEQRAPGPDQPALNVPRDEGDPELD